VWSKNKRRENRVSQTECSAESKHKDRLQILENVAQLKYLGMTVKDQNLIPKEIKRRLNPDMLATIRSGTFCLIVCCQET
jgi:hypothetical protein